MTWWQLVLMMVGGAIFMCLPPLLAYCVLRLIEEDSK
jgi:hypothetical protein